MPWGASAAGESEGVAVEGAGEEQQGEEQTKKQWWQQKGRRGRSWQWRARGRTREREEEEKQQWWQARKGTMQSPQVSKGGQHTVHPPGPTWKDFLWKPCPQAKLRRHLQHKVKQEVLEPEGQLACVEDFAKNQDIDMFLLSLPVAQRA